MVAVTYRGKSGRNVKMTQARFKKKQAAGYRRRRAANLNQYRAKKARFQASRRPFVEIKSRSHKEFWATLGGSQQYYPEVDGVVDPTVLKPMVVLNQGQPTGDALLSRLFPIWSMMNPVQGITEKDMLGRTLTAKYLSAKVQFEWPKNPSLVNPRYYLIHGWVKIPPNLTQYTTPSKANFTRGNLLTHIENHIKKDFDQNDKEEFLIFKEKTNKDYITLGYKRIRADRNAQGGINPTSGGNPVLVAGQNPIISMTLKWKINNRKIKFVKGTNNDTVITDGIPFFYDNKGWLPFLLYYCPDAGHVLPGADNSPAIAYNDKFWFSDS